METPVQAPDDGFQLLPAQPIFGPVPVPEAPGEVLVLAVNPRDPIVSGPREDLTAVVEAEHRHAEVVEQVAMAFEELEGLVYLVSGFPGKAEEQVEDHGQARSAEAPQDGRHLFASVGFSHALEGPRNRGFQPQHHAPATGSGDQPGQPRRSKVRAEAQIAGPVEPLVQGDQAVAECFEEGRREGLVDQVEAGGAIGAAEGEELLNRLFGRQQQMVPGETLTCAIGAAVPGTTDREAMGDEGHV